ncbi:MAG: diphthine--ammonia ligase [Wenzhouxiangella sp.]|nr:MAG: diphthine--ammonia ligase [Wenzhouxiangella sp.]
MKPDGIKILVLSSGGKDSLYMIARLMRDPAWSIVSLITTVNERNGRVAMHGTSAELIQAQANAVGLPLQLVPLPEDCDNATYEQRLASVLAPWRDQGVAHVACGDLFLADIRSWREAFFSRLGFDPVFPLWGEPTADMARDLVERGFRARLSCVDTQQLDRNFLGRELDATLLAELPPSVDPCGENGEFHSFVYDGPNFSHPLRVKTGQTVVTHQRFAMIELLADSG